MNAVEKKTKGTPSSIDIHVGQRIKVRRSLMGYSQEKLAEFLGITFQQIQKYEKGTNRVSAGRLYELSKILEVPVSYFFDKITGSEKSDRGAMGLSDNQQAPFSSGHASDDLMENKETIDLLKAYYSIQNPQMRKDVIKFIKSMAARMKDDS